MDTTLTVLLGSAIGVAFVHTLIGIDHSLPFVVLGKANGWSLRKTLGLTTVCGIGHVLSSVVLGLLGIGLGTAVASLEVIEASRGTLAAWTLIVFGLVYAGWAFARRRRGTRHAHQHDGLVHSHADARPTHRHSTPSATAAITAWSLFIIFVLGPCEPLIPLLMIPAAAMGTGVVVLVTATFGVVTVATMLGLVTLAYYGLRLQRMHWLEQHAQVMAGLAIAASGVVIQVLKI
jgi:sulfite exporter TauE/SafE